MFKITIDNEEVLCDKNFTINEEMLNTSSVILNNVFPKTWEQDKDYVSRFYYPKDYSKCKIFNETIHPTQPGTTQVGTNLTTTDVDLTKMNTIALEGQSYQTRTDGTNLLDLSIFSVASSFYSVSDNNVIVSAGDNRSYTAVDNYLTLPSGTYTLMSKTQIPRLQITNKDTGSVILNQYAKYVQTLTLNSTTKIIIKFLTATGTSYPFTIEKPMLVSGEYNSYSIDFVPFDTGYSSPSPDHPQPIEATTGLQSIQVCQKNLFSTEMEQGSLDNSGNITSSTTRIRTKDFISVAPNTQYTLNGTSGSTIQTIVYEYSNNGFLQTLGGTTWKSIPYTFTTSNNTINIKILIRISGNATIVPSDVSNIQLEYGNQATTYEEYNGNTYDINLGTNLLSTTLDMVQSINPGGTWNNNVYTINGLDFTYNDDGSVSVSGTASANTNFYFSRSGNYTHITLPSGTYYFTSHEETGSNSTWKTQISINGTGYNIFGNGTSKEISKTLTEDTPVYIYLVIYSGKNPNGATFYPMISKSYGIKWYPYKEPIYLYGIGNYRDCFFENVENSPYYDSTIPGGWYLRRIIGKTTIDGSGNWATAIISERYYISNTKLTGYLKTEGITSMCETFKAVENREYNSTMVNDDNNTICLGSKYDNIYIRHDDIHNIKSYFQSNPTDLYYVLDTPSYEPIDDKEILDVLQEIKLISGINNISITSPYLTLIANINYNYVKGYTEEDMLFCGVVENTGNISLNPRHPHYCNLQVLDFKTFLSEGETLDFVIYEKTIEEAIDQVISVIAPYGFIKGNINILHGDDVIGAYSTKDKTAYDVFNYLADITQSRWTTRMIDENTIAIDFYDPSLMPSGTAIEYNQTWFCNNNILDMSFNYSSKDYRNKQVMLSGEVYANVSTTEIITADGYQTQFNTTDKIGYVSSILLNGSPATIITKEEYDLGYEGDFIYQPGNPYFESDDLISTGAIITIVYYAVIEGREVLLNQNEITRINTMTGRKGVIARYENRNDATTTTELNQIGQSYLKYKGSPEITLKVQSLNNIWNIGERVSFTAPLTELTTEYMVKKKSINYIATQDNIFYTFELTSSFNSETDINYFDNQRAKTMGNIGVGEYISRNVDIENEANVIFYDLEVNEVQIDGDSTLQSTLQSPLGVE